MIRRSAIKLAVSAPRMAVPMATVTLKPRAPLRVVAPARSLAMPTKVVRTAKDTVLMAPKLIATPRGAFPMLTATPIKKSPLLTSLQALGPVKLGPAAIDPNDQWGPSDIQRPEWEPSDSGGGGSEMMKMAPVPTPTLPAEVEMLPPKGFDWKKWALIGGVAVAGWWLFLRKRR